MKHLLRIAVIAFFCAVIGAPFASAAPDGETDRKVVKRIFVRDGEVIQINGDDAVEWNLDEALPTFGNHAFLGIHVIDISEDLRAHYRAPADRGVLVSSVGKDTPAEKAGLKTGDVVLSIEGKPVTSAGKLRSLIREHQKGASVEIEAIRSGAPQKFYATLDEREFRMPRVRIPGDAKVFRHRLEESDEALKKLGEYLESADFRTRVKRIPDCAEMQAKLEALQARLNELEKKLTK